MADLTGGAGQGAVREQSDTVLLPCPDDSGQERDGFRQV